MVIDWLAVIVSIILPVVVGVGGWFGQRLVARIDSIDKRVSDMSTKASERDAIQDQQIDNLTRTSLTREDLREVLDSALQKAVSPITQELKAITTSNQETRERIIRLEAVSGRAD